MYLTFHAAVIDYAARGRKRGSGKTGERLVVEYEQRILTEYGRSDRASKVAPVCWNLGDGLGYNISSGTTSGPLIRREKKSTLGKTTAGNGAILRFRKPICH